MSKQKTTWRALPREEVIKAVERRKPSRVPLVWAKWWGEGLGEQHGEKLREFDRYPSDAAQIGIPKFDVGSMNLSWKATGGGGHDSNCLIDDWSKLDEFIGKLPNPADDPGWLQTAEHVKRAREQDLYVMTGWYGLFFETLWGLRGMQNLLMDYHLYPEQVHRLTDAMCTLYCRSIRKAAEVLRPDAFWTSDDLGHQTQSMMRRETFDELIKPYYARVGRCCRESGMHFWLHSCGNNTPLLDSLVEAGVDMFHPVQKHTMDERAVAKAYGGKLGFWIGFDVQHILREGSPEDVRAEVRHLVDTFDRSEGGMVMAAGNGIVGGTPFENIEAFLDESCVYGEAHRQRFA